MKSKQDNATPQLHMVAWELSHNCNLYCAHCRSSSADNLHHEGLSTQESFRLVDEILEVGKPVLILTGGEPLLHPDLFQIAEYAVSKGLRVVLGTNGTLITETIARKLKEIPVSRVAVSIDFPTPQLQDRFRGKTGAFQAAMAGIANAQQAGIEVQINSTITRLNVRYLDKLLDLALKVGAVAFHPFMLVPTGRGKGLKAVEMSPEEYEQILNWVNDRQEELTDRISFKPTNAPHYQRIRRQRNKKHSLPGTSFADKTGATKEGISEVRGCLAGISFCFISYQGKIQGCGFLDIEAGDIKERSFSEIWKSSSLFSQLRQRSNIKGKCGICEYKSVCGGCRARAYESTGDYLGAEPYCIYQPALSAKNETR
ncbi:MAG TPA: radical SAM protein [Dehalococcoidia bacterium]|nr:radical SAM protein [Dehalococcoidia bacterium]